MDTLGARAGSIDTTNPVILPGVFAESPEVNDFPSPNDTLPKHRMAGEPLSMRARRFGGRAALAAVCMVPVFDMAASDAVSLKVLQVSEDLIHVDSPKVESAITYGVVSADIILESMALTFLMTRRRGKGTEIFGETDQYFEKRRSEMSRPRRWLSTALNAPYAALGWMGEKIDGLDEKLAARKSRIAKVAGKLAIETGRVNALGTSTIVLEEMLAGKNPGMKRTVKLAGLLAVTWVGIAAGIKKVYDNVEWMQPPLDAAAQGFNTITSLDNPVGVTVLGGLAIGLASTGWNIAKFHEEKIEAEERNELTSSVAQPQTLA